VGNKGLIETSHAEGGEEEYYQREHKYHRTSHADIWEIEVF
jgi:hypothetical protein